MLALYFILQCLLGISLDLDPEVQYLSTTSVICCRLLRGIHFPISCCLPEQLGQIGEYYILPCYMLQIVPSRDPLRLGIQHTKELSPVPYHIAATCRRLDRYVLNVGIQVLRQLGDLELL